VSSVDPAVATIDAVQGGRFGLPLVDVYGSIQAMAFLEGELYKHLMICMDKTV
jgi:hypothetical protein